MKRICLSAMLLWGCTGLSPVSAQQKQRVFTSDIDHFWVAYDSIRTTTDSLRQLRYLRTLYIQPGTPGLQAFMEAKGYTAAQWVGAIRRYPRFWASIRPRTQLTKSSSEGLETALQKLKALYPALRPASIYFAIGALRSAGTTQGNMVLIGAELAAGSATTDVSEFPKGPNAFPARYFRTEPLRNLVPLTVHEYVHTQLNSYGHNVLGQAIYEGTCDLLTELVMGKPVPLAYRSYGPQHEAELKERFKAEMFSPSFRNWFYNQASDDPAHVPDLGYYMGYTICRSYYAQAKDKKQAVREMVELDYTSDKAVEAFVEKSRYYRGESLTELKAAFEQQRPVVVSVSPLGPAGQPVASSVKALTITFSQPMGPYASVEYGPSGQDTWPRLGKVAFSEDKKSATYPVELQPEHDYEFVITQDSFRSLDGRYPLKTYLIKFRTGK